MRQIKPVPLVSFHKKGHYSNNAPHLFYCMKKLCPNLVQKVEFWLFCSFAALITFFINIAIVIGPTPPGTGVI